MNCENSKTPARRWQCRNENEKYCHACLLGSYGSVLIRLPNMHQDAIKIDHLKNQAACIPQLAKYSHDEWSPVIPQGYIFPPCEYYQKTSDKVVTWVLVVETQPK
jgi:hypothetical protein